MARRSQTAGETMFVVIVRLIEYRVLVSDIRMSGWAVLGFTAISVGLMPIVYRILVARPTASAADGRPWTRFV